jgi:uncharacterized protein
MGAHTGATEGRLSTVPGGPHAERLDSVTVQTVRCTTCRRETPWEGNPHRPFCSERCRLVDLAAWMDECYRIPGEPVPPDATPALDDEAPAKR